MLAVLTPTASSHHTDVNSLCQVDRSFRVRKLNLHFPFPAHKTTAQTPPVLDKTLLDGEMVVDRVDDMVPTLFVKPSSVLLLNRFSLSHGST